MRYYKRKCTHEEKFDLNRDEQQQEISQQENEIDVEVVVKDEESQESSKHSYKSELKSQSSHRSEKKDIASTAISNHQEIDESNHSFSFIHHSSLNKHFFDW